LLFGFDVLTDESKYDKINQRSWNQIYTGGMYMTNSEIRAKARQDLGGNIFANDWLIPLVVMLIYSLISSAVGGIVPIVGAILVFGPLMAGISAFFLAKARKDDSVKLENMFDGFSDFSNNVLLGFMISLFTMLWTFLFIIPGIVKAYAYSMSFFIRRDHPDYTWQECMDESQRIMDGKKAKLFLLDLSFIGWWILGGLCCGVGTLWVAPYVQSARANFYELIKED